MFEGCGEDKSVYVICISMIIQISFEHVDAHMQDDGVENKSEVLGCEIVNGSCKLLYSSLQLHAPTRKAAQVVLLQVRFVLQRKGVLCKTLSA